MNCSLDQQPILTTQPLPHTPGTDTGKKVSNSTGKSRRSRFGGEGGTGSE